MTPYTTHLCLVSAQATPNLLPLLDEAWRPQRVVLACSAPMKEAAQALSRVIKTKSAGITVDLLDLPNAYDYAALEDAFLTFLAEHSDENIALNVTGGTKLMAVAAQDVFKSQGKSVFYVNVETDQVLRIGDKTPSPPLRGKLKVHEILSAHGYQVSAPPEKPQITRELRDLTARLIGQMDNTGRALGSFNALAAMAKKDRELRIELNDAQLDSRALSDIIAIFEEADLLRWQQRSIVFKDEAARFFANGGWLESHVYEALTSLRSQHEAMSDVVMGVRVAFAGSAGKRPIHNSGNPSGQTKNGSRDKNEIDVAFLYRNTLHLIECKTANLAQAGAEDDDKATEALYKMESLLKLGGLRTRGMVIDYRGQLSKSEANRERAAEAHIDIIGGMQLKDLKSHISRLWLSAR